MQQQSTSDVSDSGAWESIAFLAQYHNLPLAGYVALHEALVYHVGQLALHLVRVNILLAAEADGGSELGKRYSSAPNRHSVGRFGLGILESARCEDLSQEIAQTGIVSSLQGQVDSPLHELLLSVAEGLLEGMDIALLDTLRQGQEEFLETWVRFQKSWCREGVIGKEMTWDKVSQNKSIHQELVAALSEVSICVIRASLTPCSSLRPCGRDPTLAGGISELQGSSPQGNAGHPHSM